MELCSNDGVGRFDIRQSLGSKSLNYQGNKLIMYIKLTVTSFTWRSSHVDIEKHIG